MILLGAAQLAGAVGQPTAGAVTPQTVKLPDGPGSVRGLAGDAQVSSFTGQVAYAIPIDLPRGPGGIAPRLSLSYSGALGNGPLGIGWTLGQVGVRRSLRLGVPAYNASDELELMGLPGGALVPIGNGQVRAEGQGHSIRGVQVDGGFELIDAAGTRYRIGTNEASRLASGGLVAAWYLERVTDVAGHVIQYSYERHRGELYLTAITWGGDNAFRAELVYEARPDIVVGWRTGFSVAAARRLAAVRVHAFGGVRHTVELSYDQSFALSRLASVRTVGPDGTATPTTRLSYAAPGTGQTQALANTGGWSLGNTAVSLFDVDKDGAMDLLRIEAGSHRYRRNLGGSFAGEVALGGAAGLPMSSVRMLDLDGDSGAEMVTRSGSSWQSFRIVNNSWVPTMWPGSAALDLQSVAVADLNGDNRMDALTVSGAGIAVWSGTANGFAAPRTLPAISAGEPGITPLTVQFPDLNGDGLADAVAVNPGGLIAFRGRGDGTFERVGPIAYPWTGSTDPTQVRLADLDRDGLLDIVRIGSSQVFWYRGRPDGAFGPQPSVLNRPDGADSNTVVALADANGNGSTDVVWSAPTGMWALDLTGATSAGLLTAIDNGLGKAQRFGYTASTQLAWMAESAGNAWTQRMPVSIAVATTTTQSLASGDPDRTSLLAVRDGIYEHAERRFIGFAHAIETFPGQGASDTIRVITRFHPGRGAERVLRGQVLQSVTEDGAGNVFKQVDHTVVALAVSGMPSGVSSDPRLKRAAITQTDTTLREPGQPAARVRTRFAFDDEGRPIEERRDGRVADGIALDGDESIIRRTYTSADPVTGVRDLVYEEHTLDGAEREVSRTRRWFDDAGSTASLGQPGRGWLREENGYLAGEDRWVLSRRTTYDAHGNPITVLADGVERTIDYDAHGLHPVREAVAPAAGQVLAWTAQWDDVAGTLIRSVAPSGVVTRLTYDGLGRLTSVAANDAPAHTHYRYQWAGPRPSTETFVFDGDAADLGALPASWTPTSGWRHSVAVANSAGEQLLTAVRLDAARWIAGEFRERDHRGRVVALARPFEITIADPVPASLPAGAAKQTLVYDPLDRVIDQVLPTGTHKRATYHPLGVTIAVDGLSAVRTMRDGQGRTTRTERTVAGIVESVDATYDAAGRILRFSLQGGQVVHDFTYDSLGRLVEASDPDVGRRAMTYDDGGKLVGVDNAAGGLVAYRYDGAGRLLAVDSDQVATRYHYDVARTTGFLRTAGQLAWVEEETGTVDLGYDEHGRQSIVQRTIDGGNGGSLIGREVSAQAPSGLIRSVDLGDGVVLPMRYDAAGRLSQIDGVWSAEQLDAAGLPLRERFGNNVIQRYVRDALSRASQITVENRGDAFYDVTADYTEFGVIGSLTDSDLTGLDHTASFAFDGAGRLTYAALGASPLQYQFDYAYDGLQNLTRRAARAPGVVSLLGGNYQYDSRAPRRLTGIAENGNLLASFGYDAAGRRVQHGDKQITYDGLSQVIRVDGATGSVEHRYGYDGQRVSTRSAAGELTHWITPNVVVRGTAREHYVRIGDRVIAKITTAPDAPSGSVASVVVDRTRIAAIGLVLVCILGLSGRRARAGRRWVLAASFALLLPTLSCGPALSSQTAALAANRVYFHQTYAAGPTLTSNGDGELVEDRRTEPFGAPIDAFRDGAIHSIDYRRDPINALNKFTDGDTGWSFHGARWLAPDVAQWLSPDPPATAPDPKFMAEPWALHPYQYVEQNPVAYWDPDGRDPEQITFGKQPVDGDGKATGPYGYVNINPYRGASYGFGLLNGGLGAPNVNGTAVRAETGFGMWTDNSGMTNYGWKADVGLSHIDAGITDNRAVGADWGAINGSAGLYHNDNVTAVGAQVNVLDGAVSIGSPANQFRIGFSAGMGFSFRIWHERQPDGRLAIGGGFDVGVASADGRSTLAYDALKWFVGSQGSPFDKPTPPIEPPPAPPETDPDMFSGPPM